MAGYPRSAHRRAAQGFRLVAALLLAAGCGLSASPAAAQASGAEAWPGKWRYGFLAGYGTPPVDARWRRAGRDLIGVSSSLLRELDVHWSREGYLLYNGRLPGLSPFDRRKLDRARTDGVRVICNVAVEPESLFLTDRSGYSAFVTRNVSGLCRDVDVWQVHNEVGKRYRFPEALDYLEYLRVTSGLIRTACPDAKVMMAATVPEPSYYDALIPEADALVDAYDFHLFREGGFAQLERFAVALSESGIAKPLFVTEMATYSGQPADRRLPSQSEQTQATTLLKWFARAAAAGADYIFWNALVEWYRFGGREDGRFDLTGLVYNGLGRAVPEEEPGLKKLAYRSLQTLAAKTGRFDWVDERTEGQFEFVSGDSAVWLLWCDRAPCVAPLFGVDAVMVTDHLGQERRLPAGDLVLSAQPVFVGPLPHSDRAEGRAR